MINKVFLNQITIELCQTYVLGGQNAWKYTGVQKFVDIQREDIWHNS